MSGCYFAPNKPTVRAFETLHERPVIAAGRAFPVIPRIVSNLPVEALTLFKSDTQTFHLILSEATYGDLERGEGRARFTVGHEFGHLDMHARELMSMSFIPHHKQVALYRNKPPNHEICQDTEWQGDAFAGALLAPAHLIKGMNADDVSHGYGVTISAAATRLRIVTEGKIKL